MSKRIIQVPIDDDLLADLDKLSGSQSRSRSEIIRWACRLYLETIETERLDARYEAGYRKVPEDTIIAEAQVGLAGQILSEERW